MRGAAAVLLVLILAIFASATTVKPMTIDDLTAAASLVVEGEAVDSWTSWNAQHSLIYTFTRVRVTKSLKGIPPDSVMVKQVGGSASGYTQTVAGVHPLHAGDSAVLFLRPSEARDGTMVIVGLMQGNFRIEREAKTGAAVVNNDAADVHLSSPNGTTQYRGTRITLRQFEAQVQRAANEP